MKTILEQLFNYGELTRPEARCLMLGLTRGECNEAQAAAENASGGIVGSLFVQLLEEASGDADKAVRRLKTLLYGPSAFPDGYML